jgi:hypothetical protein
MFLIVCTEAIRSLQKKLYGCCNDPEKIHTFESKELNIGSRSTLDLADMKSDLNVGPVDGDVAIPEVSCVQPCVYTCSQQIRRAPSWYTSKSTNIKSAQKDV